MNIGIITPAPPRTRYGNRVTALRWAGILKSLHHRVSIEQEYHEQNFDLLIALHARRSAVSIRRFHKLHPDKPLIVALTGTDLYRDLQHSAQAWRSLELASRLIVLQPAALNELPEHLQHKTRVIYQSVEPLKTDLRLQTSDFRPLKRTRRWGDAATRREEDTETRRHGDNGQRTMDNGQRTTDDEQLHNPQSAIRNPQSTVRSPQSAIRICVVGHLRAVKDPFRAAMASRLLPASSRIEIIHIGKAMTEAMAQRAQREMQINPRYEWLGELSPARVQRILASSDL